MIHKVSDDEMIDELTGYHLNEVAHMNPPEDELCGIDILEYAYMLWLGISKRNV